MKGKKENNCTSQEVFNYDFLVFAALLKTPVETEEAGLMALLILKIFQAVPQQCPAVAITSPVASPALSPYLHLFLNYLVYLICKLTSDINIHNTTLCTKQVKFLQLLL